MLLYVSMPMSQPLPDLTPQMELLGSDPALPRNLSPMEPVVVVTLSRYRLLLLGELEVEMRQTREFGSSCRLCPVTPDH